MLILTAINKILRPDGDRFHKSTSGQIPVALYIRPALQDVHKAMEKQKELSET